MQKVQSRVQKLKWVIKNPGYLKYKLISFMKNGLKGKAIEDDFDWDLYTVHYKAELNETEVVSSQILNQGDYLFSNDTLIKVNEKIYTLHPNHHILYETILKLHPSTIIEFGCGGGDHLHNLQILDNSLKIIGLDRSSNQIELLKERHPSMKAEVIQNDITQNFTPKTGLDLAYSQAVIMHIQKGNSHLVALENMFKSSNKYVVLMENWKRHPFMEDINKLHKNKKIEWSELFFYYSSLNDEANTKIMIVSAKPIIGFSPLDRYEVLF